MGRWDEMCSSYRINEENIEVVDETQVKIDLEPAIKVEEVPPLAPSIGIEYNADVSKRDYNKDEDVLSYLRGIYILFLERPTNLLRYY